MCIVSASTALHATETEHVFWFDRPATAFLKSLLLGNGRLGAMVFEGAAVERIPFNDADTWTHPPPRQP